MPVNNLTFFGTGGVATSSFPFKLTAGSVRLTPGTASNTTLDCQCPYGLTQNGNITSSKLFVPLLTDEEKAAIQVNPSAPTKLGVTIARESFLFRGLFPSIRPSFGTDPEDSEYGEKNSDPVIRVYGLDQPIVTQDFLAGELPDSTKTVKIWLTVCFPSGEPLGTASEFTACQPGVNGDISGNVQRSNWRSIMPLVAFISYGIAYPTNLVQVKLIDTSNPQANPPAPRTERRQVEAHVPLGEVNVAGKVVAQYVKSNLVLTDLCFNGTPAKYPMPVFTDYNT